ncbi:uncharacterized protein V1510DRAFT_421624 [Dipodascopsis tothii]|uniref:uncharacterized protein n=1 Tax=Dipodascopsis tothii TaxID=44089 RepID=UPI0034CEAA46
MFEVRPTPYGGRGCYATTEIPAGTRLHVSTAPFTSVIFREFRKEVCANCFKYDMGRTTWKVRIERLTHSAGLLFCTDACRDSWITREDRDGAASKALEAVEVASTLGRKSLQQLLNSGQRREEFEILLPEDGTLTDSFIDEQWAAAEQLAVRLKRKKSGLSQEFKNSLMQLEDVEYDFVRLILMGVLHHHAEVVSSDGEKQEVPPEFSWSLFWQLESHELDLVKKLPALLQAHIKAYLFLRMTLPQYHKSITPQIVRGVMGRESANAFGIWQQPLNQESECLGSALFPSASYFNHSCRPNVTKSRHERAMHFVASQTISAGDEVCISYGLELNPDPVVRQTLLLDQWYFTCGCVRCVEDLAENLKASSLEEKNA